MTWFPLAPHREPEAQRQEDATPAQPVLKSWRCEYARGRKASRVQFSPAQPSPARKERWSKPNVDLALQDTNGSPFCFANQRGVCMFHLSFLALKLSRQELKLTLNAVIRLAGKCPVLLPSLSLPWDCFGKPQHHFCRRVNADLEIASPSGRNRLKKRLPS